MIDKYKIITDMCYTMRHDYGLDKHPDDLGFAFSISSGMTDDERRALFRQMEQLYNHHIQPLVDMIEDTNNGTSTS
jgi:hypothetical protein